MEKQLLLTEKIYCPEKDAQAHVNHAMPMELYWVKIMLIHGREFIKYKRLINK